MNAFSDNALALDSKLSCGFILAIASRETLAERARALETAGFDSIWMGDHIAFHFPMLESLNALSFLAGVTERIALATGVYLLALRQPALAAKSAATVDFLSNGRLIFGVGVGGEYPPEFEAMGIPVEERGARTDEAIQLLRRFWSEERVGYQGPYQRFSPIRLDPRPVQTGGPPIWIGGRSPAAFRRAGQLADGFFSTMTSPERYCKNLEAIAQHAREANRAPLPFGSGALLFCEFDASYEAAAQHAAQTLGGMYQRSFDEAVHRYCLLGRPEDCLEKLRTFAEAGVRHVALAPLSRFDEHFEIAAKEILPELHRWKF